MLTADQIWDELDNYVAQVPEPCFESEYLVNMIVEMHEINEVDRGRVAVHVDSWLQKGGRIGGTGNEPVKV